MRNFSDTVKKMFKTGFVHIFGSNILNRVIVFAGGMILVRVLSKEEYGRYTYAWNIYSIIVLLNGFGLATGSLQIGSETNDNDKKRVLFTYAAKTGLIFDCLIGVCMLFAGIFINFGINGTKQLIISLSLLPLLTYYYDLMVSYCRTQKYNKIYSYISIINTALILFFSVIGAIAADAMGLIIGRYFAYVITILWGTYLYNIHFYKKSFLKKNEKIDLIKISIISMVSNGLSHLLYLTDVFLLGIIIPDANILADYKIATYIPATLAFIPQSIMVYCYPYFANHKDDKKWVINAYKKMLLPLIILSSAIVFVLSLVAGPTIAIVFGSNYVGVIKIYRLLLINFFFSCVFRIMIGNILVTQRQFIFNLVESVLSGILNIIGDIFLIGKYGSTGAAYSTILVTVFSSIIDLTYFVKYSYKIE